MPKATVSTTGFTKTTAEGFFERLLNAGIQSLVDVRLHNTSQLAGFAKADDLAYLLKKIGGIQYVHQPLLAPTDSMLKAYKKDSGDWHAYEERFLGLMSERQITFGRLALGSAFSTRTERAQRGPFRPRPSARSERKMRTDSYTGSD